MSYAQPWRRDEMKHAPYAVLPRSRQMLHRSGGTQDDIPLLALGGSLKVTAIGLPTQAQQYSIQRHRYTLFLGYAAPETSR